MRVTTSADGPTPSSPREQHEAFLRRLHSNPPGTFVGVPSYLRAHCHNASRGGGSGYREAGFHLGLHVYQEEPYDLNYEEWADLIDSELIPLIDAHDDDAVAAWLARRYPRVMALVPARRRRGFVRGFYAGFGEGGGQ